MWWRTNQRKHHENSRHKRRGPRESWDLGTQIDNTLAGLGVCSISEEWLAEQARKPPPPVKDEFEKCVDLLLEKFNRVDVPWGRINRLIRGGQNWPVNGGPDVMRAIYGLGLEEDGYHTAVAGDGLFIFVSWDKDGKQSIESIHQFGSATTNLESPHYDDQSAQFVAEKMKQTFFEASELEASIEREYKP